MRPLRLAAIVGILVSLPNAATAAVIVLDFEDVGVRSGTAAQAREAVEVETRYRFRSSCSGT
jgi:hypothetical protein